MDASAFCNLLFDFLDDFDASIPPLGLYACDDLPAGDRRKARHQEWHRGLKPRLEQIGCPAWRHFYERRDSQGVEATLEVPGIGRTGFKLAKVSKIKVRKYGSHYRVDRLEDFGERWEGLRLERDLSDLWKASSLADLDTKMRVVLFLGFDKVEEPFARELSGLERSVPWAGRGVTYESRAMRDRYDRNFFIRVSAWARPS